MIRRPWFLAFLLLLAVPAHADWVAWLPQAPDAPRATTFALAEGVLLVGPPQVLPPAGARLLDTRGRDAFLITRADLTQELRAFVLHADDRFIVVAPPSPQTLGVEVARRKIALRHLPAAPGGARPPLLRKRVDPGVKTALVGGVSAARFSQLVQELSGWVSVTVGGNPETLDNRYTHRPTHLTAAQWIREQFEDMGYPVEEQGFRVVATDTHNVIATKTGSVAPDEIVVVGGHYDSICFSGCNAATDPAPGAEDNASGVAATLQLAELLANYETERTVVFIAFGGEEQGLHGSRHYATELGAGVANVVAALTMDMVSYRSAQYGVVVEGFDGTENGGAAADSRSLIDLFEANAASTVPALATTEFIPGFGSDHQTLDYAGIPAILVIEAEWAFYPHYHRGTDTFDKLDVDYGTDVVRALMATLADLANPLPQVPVLVSALAAEAVGRDVRVQWSLATPGVSGVWVLRGDGDGPLRRLTEAPLPGHQSRYLDRQIEARPGTELRYGLEVRLRTGDILREDQQTTLVFSPPGLWVGQPHPNPTPASTRIAYALPERAHLTATVYDLAGRAVRTLADRETVEGWLTFDGTDGHGRAVGAGVYLLRVQVDGAVETRRLTVLR